MDAPLRLPARRIELRCLKTIRGQDLPVHFDFPQAPLQFRAANQPRRLELVLRIQILEENVHRIAGV